MFRDRRCGECVNAARHSNEDPLPVEAQQGLSGDTASLDVARAD
jgi:hypothetical protein